MGAMDKLVCPCKRCRYEPTKERNCTMLQWLRECAFFNSLYWAEEGHGQTSLSMAPVMSHDRIHCTIRNLLSLWTPGPQTMVPFRTNRTSHHLWSMITKCRWPNWYHLNNQPIREYIMVDTIPFHLMPNDLIMRETIRQRLDKYRRNSLKIN